MSKKHQDLQPWIDYFQMLRTYEEKGFLQVEADKHEAYVTEPAFYTLANYDDTTEALADSSSQAIARRMTAVRNLVRRLRIYAAWKSTGGGTGYDSYPFAVHTVKPDEPHDLLHTIVLTTSRPWWKLWMKHDHYEAIFYSERPFTVTPQEK